MPRNVYRIKKNLVLPRHHTSYAYFNKVKKVIEIITMIENPNHRNNIARKTVEVLIERETNKIAKLRMGKSALNRQQITPDYL